MYTNNWWVDCDPLDRLQLFFCFSNANAKDVSRCTYNNDRTYSYLAAIPLWVDGVGWSGSRSTHECGYPLGYPLLFQSVSELGMVLFTIKTTKYIIRTSLVRWRVERWALSGWWWLRKKRDLADSGVLVPQSRYSHPRYFLSWVRVTWLRYKDARIG